MAYRCLQRICIDAHCWVQWLHWDVSWNSCTIGCTCTHYDHPVETGMHRFLSLEYIGIPGRLSWDVLGISGNYTILMQFPPLESRFWFGCLCSAKLGLVPQVKKTAAIFWGPEVILCHSASNDFNAVWFCGISWARCCLDNGIRSILWSIHYIMVWVHELVSVLFKSLQFRFSVLRLSINDGYAQATQDMVETWPMADGHLLVANLSSILHSRWSAPGCTPCPLNKTIGTTNHCNVRFVDQILG